MNIITTQEQYRQQLEQMYCEIKANVDSNKINDVYNETGQHEGVEAYLSQLISSSAINRMSVKDIMELNKKYDGYFNMNVEMCAVNCYIKYNTNIIKRDNYAY